MNPESPLRIAAVGDLHCTKDSAGRLAPLFTQASRLADVLVLCGDLTDYGMTDEAHVLAKELEAAGSMPVIGVLGNHDFESGHEQEIMAILNEAGVNMLDGTSYEIHGVAFAGTKGFGGGFSNYALQPWGERAIKAFVQEALSEALKLESALAKSRSARRVVALHYSPIAQTLIGEPQEIFPFLGSSRLEEPIERYSVTAVVHGHAHRGTPEGRTRMGIPVYNTSLPLLRKSFPNQPPLRLVTLPGVESHEPARA
jgi:Icc-related predicted phosphoesterase